MKMQATGKVCALATAMLLTAMLVQPTKGQEPPFARMDVRGKRGDQAWVERQLLKKFQKNVPLQDGSMVTTGKETGALVTMPESQIVLSENSLKLISYSYFKGARCYLAHLRKGKMLIDGSKVCFMTDESPLLAYSHSLINVKHVGQDVEMTVVEGEAEVEKPAPMRIAAGNQLLVHPDGTFSTTRLTPDQLQKTVRWSHHYIKRSDTGRNVATGIGITVLAYGVCRLLGGCDGGDGGHQSPPPPQPTPTEDAPQPPPRSPSESGTQATPLPGNVLKASPAYLTEECCVAGTTQRLTRQQCSAQGGELGKCLIVK